MTPEHTDMTGAARLREALERLLRSLDTSETLRRRHDCREDGVPMVVVRMTRDDVQEIEIAERKAREALAAVPEAPESPDDLLTVTLRRGQWTVLLSAASDYGKRVPLEQGDGGACLDAIREALGERVEEGTER